MASVWITKRETATGPRYRVLYRAGGREAPARYAGSFKTRREALARKAWVSGELAQLRMPDIRALEQEKSALTVREAAKRWQASRVDIREATRVQHRSAVGRLLPVLGDRRVDELAPADVADLVAKLDSIGKARETIRKTLTAFAMILDHAGVSSNVARDRVKVKLPRQEPQEPEPPTAEAVEAVAWVFAPRYRLALLTLDATGCRAGELEAARVGDLDENRQAWLVRAAVSKTRRARWVELPDDLYAALVAKLTPREDRDPTAELFPGVTQERLRMAITRACLDGGVPRFSPHSLRHRRISLLHRQGRSWAEIGEQVGQRSELVTADRYLHVIGDYAEVDRKSLIYART